MGKKYLIDFNIRDKAYIILKNGQVYKGIITELNSQADDSYEIIVAKEESNHLYIGNNIRVFEEQIEDIKVIEKNAIERGKTI